MKCRRIFAGVAVLATLCCRRAPEKTSQPAPESTPSSSVHLSPEAVRAGGIQTTTVDEGRLARTVTLTGTLAAKPWTPEEQTVLSEAASADARLRLAQARFERVSRLAADGVAARQDVDAARAERDEARAAAALADAKRANLGLSETSGSLERQARIWGLANLPEIDLPQVHGGERVEVTTAAFAGDRFSGRVIGVSRSADPETRSFTVRVAVDDPSGRLRPQMLATFGVSTPTSSGLVIPRSAVLFEGDGTYVYVARGETFQRRPVRLAESTSEEVQVLSGLSREERVVTRGAQILESERLKSRLPALEKD